MLNNIVNDYSPRNIPVEFTNIEDIYNEHIENYFSMDKSVRFNERRFRDYEVGLLDKFPGECPFCHKGITPANPLGINTLTDDKKTARVIFRCDHDNCKEVFIAYYNLKDTQGTSTNPFYVFKETMIGKILKGDFDEIIDKISPSFANIYNQAFAAEQYKLTEICGAGYRKALEFLIKDFTKNKNPEKISEIEKMSLDQVIKNYISDDEIKDVSTRATWLGNDETHYVRIWEEKDINDLRETIGLAVSFIEKKEKAEKLKKSMPNKK